MEIAEIEQILDIIKDARISELTLSTGDPKTTIKFRKPLVQASAVRHSEPTPMRDSDKKANHLASNATASSANISAPMVGVFHSADRIIAAGATIKAGQVVGAIESMKLMNDIISEHDGMISEVLIEDGMPVEFGQTLFKLDR